MYGCPGFRVGAESPNTRRPRLAFDRRTLSVYKIFIIHLSRMLNEGPTMLCRVVHHIRQASCVLRQFCRRHQCCKACKVDKQIYLNLTSETNNFNLSVLCLTVNI